MEGGQLDINLYYSRYLDIKQHLHILVLLIDIRKFTIPL